MVALHSRNTSVVSNSWSLAIRMIRVVLVGLALVRARSDRTLESRHGRTMEGAARIESGG